MAKFSSAKSVRRKERKRKGRIATRSKKEFTYCGMTIDELQELSFEEVLPLLPARARRSMVRGIKPNQEKFWKHVENDKEVIKTHRRDIVILPKLIGRKISVYNGNSWVEFEVMPEMIGHFLGEFALTRNFKAHTGPGVGATKSSKFMPLR
jgi:small subunit ribosomal protein S19